MKESVERRIVNFIKTINGFKYELGNSFRHENNTSKKILIVKTDVLGDMVIAIPFIRNVRYNYPDAQITLVCNKNIYNLIELCPYVDCIVQYPPIKPKKRIFERKIWHAYKFTKKCLSAAVYDIIFMPKYTASADDKLISAFSLAKRRIGYEYIGTMYSLMSTDILFDGNEVKLDLQRFLDLLRLTGHRIKDDFVELWTTKADTEYAEKIIEGINAKYKMVVFLSTSALNKNWDINKFISVCNYLSEKFSMAFILLGDAAGTGSLGKKFADEVQGTYNYIGKTTIRETIEIIKHCNLYLGGDTGTMHLAAACGIHGVVVAKDYPGAHPNNDHDSTVDRYLPWQSPLHLIRPQKPLPGCEICCTHDEAHCINQITVEEVVKKLEKVIANELAM